MAAGGSGGRFSALLLEGLDHYRKGRMLEAVKAWEEAYLLEPTNLRAREFLRSALERIHAHMGPAAAKPAMPEDGTPAAGAPHPWLPQAVPPASQTQTFAVPPLPPQGRPSAPPPPPIETPAFMKPV